MTPAQRFALIAVVNGVVRLAAGGRVYPRGVNGRALTAAYDHGYWRWPTNPPRTGDVAVLTTTGREALA